MKNIKQLLFLLAILLYLSTSNIFCQTYEVYVSDAGNFSSPPWQILKFDENGENPSVFIKDEIAWPQDILFLEDQNVVLISNLNTNRITKHDAETGAFLENFATGISGPTRMKIGADSLLYVLQWSGTGKVKRYQLDGTFVDDFTSTGVTQSIGIDWDDSGNLYVSSYNGDHVRKFDGTGSDMGLYITTNLLGPTNIWFDESGDLLVSDYNGTAVKRFDSLGVFKGNFLTGLSNSEGVAFFPNGDILIGNGATSSVKLFSSEGNFIKDLIASGAGNLQTPNAVVLREKTAVSVFDGNNLIIPDRLTLEQNYPNPFNPATKIKFTIPSHGGQAMAGNENVRSLLIVYDILGNEIITLVDENKSPGVYEVEFNAADLPSGIYFYKLTSGAYVDVKKMTLIK